MKLKPLLILLIAASTLGFAQERKIKWKRSAPEAPVDLQLLHSTHVVNLPTAETLQKGDLEFEISHRFVPRVNDGGKTLFGFDGPVNMRIALGYALSNSTMLTLGRSNVADNYDLIFKYKFAQFVSKTFPVSAAFNFGAAWNTEVTGRNAGDSKNFQYFGQLVLNSLIAKKFGFGIVPSYVYNSHIYCADTQYTFAVGTYAQYYFSDLLSFAVETNSTVSGWRSGHNSVSFSIDLETGGHFFKILLTNNINLNTTQFLEGAVDSFNDGNLHFGFMITRLLKF